MSAHSFEGISHLGRVFDSGVKDLDGNVVYHIESNVVCGGSWTGVVRYPLQRRGCCSELVVGDLIRFRVLRSGLQISAKEECHENSLGCNRCSEESVKSPDIFDEIPSTVEMSESQPSTDGPWTPQLRRFHLRRQRFLELPRSVRADRALALAHRAAEARERADAVEAAAVFNRAVAWLRVPPLPTGQPRWMESVLPASAFESQQWVRQAILDALAVLDLTDEGTRSVVDCALGVLKVLLAGARRRGGKLETSFGSPEWMQVRSWLHAAEEAAHIDGVTPAFSIDSELLRSEHRVGVAAGLNKRKHAKVENESKQPRTTLPLCPCGLWKRNCARCTGCVHGRLPSDCIQCCEARSALCSHGKVRKRCVKCLGCLHGVWKHNCQTCSVCIHGKVTQRCIHCRGCIHGKLRHNCAACNACPHGRLKKDCVKCKGCEHGKTKRNCAVCSGCRHGKAKRYCRVCTGCPHEKLKENCGICTGCVHGKLKHSCVACSGCPHGKVKRKCILCSRCGHGVLRARCSKCRVDRFHDGAVRAGLKPSSRESGAKASEIMVQRD
eukprot:TRINITY_DN48823_c0_g1_i1.p1 TRINITY_DN48823_c0_g1~~TRINITY_DN48823_c0_g1_i1.p1  ORF type:complete len:553 (-),score=67.42 TRINITY_DN48823_c0_g1_i1:33-1691(-)